VSLCVILADATQRGGEKLTLRQVIECLAYDHTKRCVLISVDMLITNERQEDASLFLVHRGAVKVRQLPSIKFRHAVMDKDGELTAEEILKRIYSKRLVVKDDQTGIDGYHERENCHGMKIKPTRIHHSCPSGIDARLVDAMDWRLSEVEFLPFTAFDLPSIPSGTSWIRVGLTVEGPTYDDLVASQAHFWVNGPDFVVKEIRDKDLPERGYLVPGCEDFFGSRVIRQKLDAAAYDVVILQPGVKDVPQTVDCTPVNGKVFEASIDDELAAKHARLFVSRSSAFWIDCTYVFSGVLAAASDSSWSPS